MTDVEGENIYAISLKFNQDASCFVCGTTAGFRAYSMEPLDEVVRRETRVGRSIGIIEMLFKTNIFAVVQIADPKAAKKDVQKKVKLWDDHKKDFIGELRSRHDVKGCVMRRDVIAMVCEYSVYLYSCNNFNVILHISTGSNPRGLCTLAPAGDQWILCCPGTIAGNVHVQLGQDDQTAHSFSAHQTALAALASNISGTMVATASEYGTVVKVFQTSTGMLLFEFRRGSQPSLISSIVFRADDKFLAVASSSPTIHIFKLEAYDARLQCAQMGPDLGSQEALQGTLTEMGGAVVGAVAAMASSAAADTAKEMLMSAMPKYFTATRSWAQFRIPDIGADGKPTVDIRARTNDIVGPQVAFGDGVLHVVHYNGISYECQFQEEVMGLDCKLITATTWFATRPDFHICMLGNTVQGGAGEEQEVDEWQLL